VRDIDSAARSVISTKTGCATQPPPHPGHQGRRARQHDLPSSAKCRKSATTKPGTVWAW
jgi:hypothetical protein